MIQLEGVKKSYANKCVLDIPCLALEPNRRYALIGHNGSGKSTLLRIFAGVLAPDCGMAAVPDAIRKTMGYMPQRPYAYSFSVLKNVCIAQQAEDIIQARLALSKVGMADLQTSKGNQLSGGEAQRMAFARMIVIKRQLLLLDEPTSATDITGTEMIENTLISYCNENQCTLLFATHSLAQAQRVADTVILLDNGRIAELGDKNAVLLHPQSEPAQAFLKLWNLERS